MSDTTGVTNTGTLAGNDQGASGRSELELLQQRFNGLNGKLMETERQKLTTETTLREAKTTWETEKAQLLEQLAATKTGIETTQSQLADAVAKWSEANIRATEIEKQAARQAALLKYPALISDPILKLVETSTLPAADLEQTLLALADSQKKQIKDLYQEVQSGSTSPVAPPVSAGDAAKDAAKSEWEKAMDAMSKGDIATYRKHYSAYISQTDGGSFKAPTSLAKPM